MNVPARKILKRVNHFDPTAFNKRGQFLQSAHEGKTKALGGQRKVNSVLPGRGFPTKVRIGG